MVAGNLNDTMLRRDSEYHYDLKNITEHMHEIYVAVIFSERPYSPCISSVPRNICMDRHLYNTHWN
jgi:hypothetical protein